MLTSICPTAWIETARRTGALLLAAIALAAIPCAAAVAAETVETPGSGVLTMCQDWILFHTCRTYHHIVVPPRVAIGDTIRLDFGSNPKKYRFAVVRIVQDGDSCTIFSGTAGEEADKIEVAPCRATAAAH